jgi:hypothetical protein
MKTCDYGDIIDFMQKMTRLRDKKDVRPTDYAGCAGRAGGVRPERSCSHRTRLPPSGNDREGGGAENRRRK